MDLQGTALPSDVKMNFGFKYRNFSKQKVAEPNTGFEIYKKKSNQSRWVHWEFVEHFL